MKELVQILKNTRQHLMTGVSHMILCGGWRNFAGSLRHAIWQGRRTRCRHRSES